MSQVGFLVNVFSAIPVLLVHLAGTAVAIILLVRQDRAPISAVLALVGFGLLLVLDLLDLARGPVIRLLLHRTAVGDREGVAGVRCCCGLIDVVAIVCLITAIWRASSRALQVEGASRR